MASPGIPTFDQLRVFLAVVEEGSFAGAGRKLHRATSAISYAIANLEAQLGLAVFDRETTRKPQLTVAGRAVLAEAGVIAHGIDGLRAKVKGLLEGLEAEVCIAVDVMLPADRLGDALKAFQQEYPTVTLRLFVEGLGAVAALVLEGRATVGISGPLAAEIGGIERVGVGTVEMVPVVAPGHPLARLDRIVPGATREHVQLVLTDRSPLTEGRDFAVSSARTWRLGDLGAKLQLLREGVGWGHMPLPMIADDLARGTLVALDLPDGAAGRYRFDAIYRPDSPPGPAATWLLAKFGEQT